MKITLVVCVMAMVQVGYAQDGTYSADGLAKSLVAKCLGVSGICTPDDYGQVWAKTWTEPNIVARLEALKRGKMASTPFKDLPKKCDISRSTDPYWVHVVVAKKDGGFTPSEVLDAYVLEYKKLAKISSSSPCPEHRVFAYVSRESKSAALRPWVDGASLDDFTSAVRLIEEALYPQDNAPVNVGTAVLLALDGVEKYYKGAQPSSYVTMVLTLFGGISSLLVLMTTYGFYLRAHQRRNRVQVRGGGGNRFDVFDRFARDMALQVRAASRYF